MTQPTARLARVELLFDRLLDGEDPAIVFASDPDPEVCAEAERLWSSHIAADSQGFLASRPGVTIPPVYEPGQLVAGRFEIESSLGVGGMGEVYLAWDRRLSSRVAVKTIALILASSETVRRRFLAEVQNARQVTHRNVCRIHDLFEDGQNAFFTMEYVPGKTLGARLEEGPLPQEQAREVLRQMAEGLAAAHRVNVVHGDLKPLNVILADSDRPVITDFGLARALGQEDSTTEHVYSLRGGSSGYMAPELLEGHPPSIATDVYALGRIGQEVLPGEKIWSRCTDANPARRTPGAAQVAAELARDNSRRYWLGGLGLAVAAVAGTTWLSSRRGPVLTGRQKAVLGRVWGEGDLAKIARYYVQFCLRQSELIGVLPPDTVATTAVREQELTTLVEQARRQRAAIVIVGDAWQNGPKPGLRLTAHRAEDMQQTAEVADEARGADRFGDMVSEVVRRLRIELGEPSNAVDATSWRLSAVTTESPVATRYYFQGVEAYESGETHRALDFFEEAVRADGQFALGYFGQSRALSNMSREAEAIAAAEAANAHRARTSRTDALEIEGVYQALTGHQELAIPLYRRLAQIQPERPGTIRQYGNLLASTGEMGEAVKVIRQAVEIDPASQMNWSALANYEAESGEPDRALATVAQARQAGLNHPSLLWGEAEAWALKGDVDKARAILTQLSQAVRYSRLGRFHASMMSIWSGRLAEARFELRSDLVLDEAQNAGTWRIMRGIRLAQLEMEFGNPRAALTEVEKLETLPAIPLHTAAFRDAALVCLAAGSREWALRFAARLDEVAAKYPNGRRLTAFCDQVAGALAVADRKLDEAAARLNRAYGLFPDCETHFSLGQFHSRTGQPELAREVLGRLLTRTGMVLQRSYPGLLVQAWSELGRMEDAQGRQAEAREHYGRVVRQWRKHGADLPVVQAAVAWMENNESKKGRA